MKKKFFIMLLTFLPFLGFNQAFDWMSYGSTDFTQVENGNTINITGNNIVKLDASGNQLFSYSYVGGIGATVIHGVSGNSSGEFVVYGKFGVEDFDLSAGTHQLTSVSGTQDIFYAKYDMNAQLVYVNTINTGGSLKEVIIDENGYIYGAGTVQGFLDYYNDGTTLTDSHNSISEDVFYFHIGQSANTHSIINADGDQYFGGLTVDTLTETVGIGVNTISSTNWSFPSGTNYTQQYGSTNSIIFTLTPYGDPLDSKELEDGFEGVADLVDIEFGSESLIYFVGNNYSSVNVQMYDNSFTSINNNGDADIIWGVLGLENLSGTPPLNYPAGLHYIASLGSPSYEWQIPELCEINAYGNDVYLMVTLQDSVDFDHSGDVAFQTVMNNWASTLARYEYDVYTGNCSFTNLMTIGGNSSDYMSHFEITPTDDIYVTVSGNNIDVDPSPVTNLQPTGGLIKYNGSSSVISGIVYQDDNSTGTYETTDPLLSNAPVEIDNGSYSFNVSTNSSGEFKAYVSIGNYTVTVPFNSFGYFNGSTPNSYSVSVNNSNSLYGGNDFGLSTTPGISDLKITISPLTPVRPGFPADYKIIVNNVGTSAENATINFEHDNQLSFISSSITPSNQVNNTLSWTLGSISPGDSAAIELSLQCPADIGLDVLVTQFASIDSTFSDENMLDNQYTLNQITQGSYDPNDKSVQPKFITQDFVDNNELLNYLIRFQNTGTDTAFNVIIRDTLDNFINPNSIEILSESHNMIPTMYFDSNSGRQIMEFKFPNILLPDSTTNEPESNGYVSFSAALKSGFTVGDIATNTADIYFDYNSPIITNTTITRINTINLDDVISDLNCYNTCDGEINLTPSGGIAPYDYYWSEGSNSNSTYSGLCEGTYNVMVTDDIGNTIVSSYNVNAPTELQINYSVDTTSSTGGIIETNALGGTPPYEYSIDNGMSYQNDSIFTELDPNFYDICVKDANGCVICETDVEIPMTSGLVEFEGNANVYPNPTKGVVTVELTKGIEQITILDLLGKVVYSDNNINSNSCKLDLNHLQQGTYLLLINNNSQPVKIQKLNF